MRELEQYDDDRQVLPYREPVETVPSWSRIRVPARPDSDVQITWQKIVYVPRALAVAFLIITETWWRSALVAGTALALLILLH